MANVFENGDVIAREEIFKIIIDRKKAYTAAMDYVAGLLGLRLNKLLVSKVIQEQQYIYKKNGMAIQSSVKITATDSFTFDQENSWLTAIEKNNGHLSSERWAKPAGTFVWLLRGWGTDDIVLKFFSFMTALECVIPKPRNDKIPEDIVKTNLLSLIKANVANSESSAMIKMIQSVSTSPPLAVRFERWAQKAALPGWEIDVSNYRRFNKLRNQLFHTGNPGVDFHVETELKDIASLEDLTERYVSLAVFGDARVYASSNRRKIED